MAVRSVTPEDEILTDDDYSECVSPQPQNRQAEIEVYNAVDTNPKAENVIAPPTGQRILIKGGTVTFNHLYDFCIHNNEVWYRKRNDLSDPWKNIPFDASSYYEELVSISADGANLMVQDNLGVIHYKKILQETRKGNAKEYAFNNICAANTWVKQWYCFPVLRLAPRVVCPTKLKLPKGVTLWACSHRGRFNEYWEDMRGVQHPEFSMVTTCFAVKPDGKNLCYADPYISGHFKHHNIAGPNPSDDPSFCIHVLDAAASCILVIGRGNNLKDRLFTRFTDFDMLGKNPILPGFFSGSHTVFQAWVEHNLPAGIIQYTKGSICCTGMGNAARLIAVESTTGQIFNKRIFDNDWVLVP